MPSLTNIYAASPATRLKKFISCVNLVSTALGNMPDALQVCLTGFVESKLSKQQVVGPASGRAVRDIVQQEIFSNVMLDFHNALLMLVERIPANMKSLEDDLQQQVVDGVLEQKVKKQILAKFGVNVLLCHVFHAVEIWAEAVSKIALLWWFSVPDPQKVSEAKDSGITKPGPGDMKPKTHQGYFAFCKKLATTKKLPKFEADFAKFSGMVKTIAKNNPLEYANFYAMCTERVLNRFRMAALLSLHVHRELFWARPSFQLGGYADKNSCSAAKVALDTWVAFNTQFVAALQEWKNRGVEKPWFLPGSIKAMDKALATGNKATVEECQRQFWYTTTKATAEVVAEVLPDSPEGDSPASKEPQKAKKAKKPTKKRKHKDAATGRIQKLARHEASQTERDDGAHTKAQNQNTDPKGTEEVSLAASSLTDDTPKKAAAKRNKKPKPVPQWKKEKNVRSKLMVSHQEIEAKGKAARAKNPDAPLLVYFFCPYCDHAREISPSDFTKEGVKKAFPNGMADVRCAPIGTREGSQPVDQLLGEEKEKLRNFVAWGKMRTHILECLFLVKWKNNPELAKAAKEDPIMAEEHLPDVFRSMARKYSRKDTQAAPGKLNYAFYKRESTKKKKAAKTSGALTQDAAADAVFFAPISSEELSD